MKVFKQCKIAMQLHKLFEFTHLQVRINIITAIGFLLWFVSKILYLFHDERHLLNKCCFQTCIEIDYTPYHGNVTNFTEWLQIKSTQHRTMIFALTEKTAHHLNNEHDDDLKWKYFPRYWSFEQGIHRSPVNSPHKGQRRRALMFSFICAWINVWFETPSNSLWRHRNGNTIPQICKQNNFLLPHCVQMHIFNRFGLTCIWLRLSIIECLPYFAKKPFSYTALCHNLNILWLTPTRLRFEINIMSPGRHQFHHFYKQHLKHPLN